MSISISCPHCRRPYRLKDQFAGKQVRCRECQREFAVPAVLERPKELTAGGESIYRYEQRTEHAPLVGEATPFMAEIERHIARHVGDAPYVVHELVSEDVHLDLYIVPPSLSEPTHAHPLGTDHFTIITSGMSSRPMTLPRSASPEMRYAELMIALPADWPGMGVDGSFGEVMNDERNWWPIRWLKNLARFPHMYQTFLSRGHTIPSNDPPEPYADNTELCCLLVDQPLLCPPAGKLIVNDDTAINFYALWPIYKEEIQLKLEQGCDALRQKFDEFEMFELIDPRRPNTCR